MMGFVSLNPSYVLRAGGRYELSVPCERSEKAHVVGDLPAGAKNSDLTETQPTQHQAGLMSIFSILLLSIHVKNVGALASQEIK
jgi:hypothetical protein